MKRVKLKTRPKPQPKPKPGKAKELPAIKPPERSPDEKDDLLTVWIKTDWRLQWDGAQWLMQVQRENKVKQTPYWSTLGYYRNLDLALGTLLRNRIFCHPGTYDDRALEPLLKMCDEMRDIAKNTFSDAMRKAIKTVYSRIAHGELDRDALLALLEPWSLPNAP